MHLEKTTDTGEWQKGRYYHLVGIGLPITLVVILFLLASAISTFCFMYTIALAS